MPTPLNGKRKTITNYSREYMGRRLGVNFEREGGCFTGKVYFRVIW
jgi:hypothetical protein